MRKKKILAALLALVMVVTLLPLTAVALEKEVTRWKAITELTQLGDGADCVIVYQNGSVAKPRTLYHASGAAATDQLQAVISGDILDITSTRANFAENTIVWHIAPASDGKYTIKSTVGDNMYLDLTDTTTGAGSGTSAKVGSSAKELKIEKSEDGGFIISSDESGATHYLKHGDTESGNGRFFYTGEEAEGTPFVIYTQVTENVEVGVAPNHYEGRSDNGQPMNKESVNTDYFRIPAMTTLKNGWIVAAADIRWKSDIDNPQNIDIIVSVSKDNGETWEWETLNYMGDYSIGTSSTNSASFIDSAIVEAGDGSIWVASDITPFMQGAYGYDRSKLSNQGTGYDADGSMLVTKVANPSTSVMTPAAPASFTYRVDLQGKHGTEKAADLWGKEHTVYPIYPTSGDEDTGVYVDSFFNLYEKNDDGSITPVTCEQYGSTDYTQNNIMYAQCEYRLFPTFYFCLRKGTIEGEKIVWEDPIYPNVRYSTQNAFFFGVCPGRGATYDLGGGKERIMFQCYDNATNNELASTFYSDDGGVTWQRGQRAASLGSSGKSSESQIITLPDGNLRMYSRNTANYISYADSTDGGVNWGTYVNDTNLKYASNCMVSFINVEGTLVDTANNKEYTNLVMGSYPKDTNRQNGTVRIGYMTNENGTYKVNWLTTLSSFDSDLTGHFQYSCLTQMKNSESVGIDKFGILYEPDVNSKITCLYKSFSVADVLGEGYYLKPVAPTKDEIAALVGEVTVTDNSGRHTPATYTATADSITIDTPEPAQNEEGVYTVTAQLSKDVYLALYNGSNPNHTLVGDANVQFTLTYDTETRAWVIEEDTDFSVEVTCPEPTTPPVVNPPVTGGDTQVPDDEPPLDAEPDDGTDIEDEGTPLAPAPDGDTDIEDGDTPLDSTPKTGDDSIAIAILWSIFSLSAVGFAAVMLGMKKSGKHTR